MPFKQAVKLPILLYHPHFVCLKGKVLLDSSIISFGMITLGFNKVTFISQYRYNMGKCGFMCF